MKRDMKRLDELATRAVRESAVAAPSRGWLEARVARRRVRRRAGAAVVGLAVLGGGLWAIASGRSSSTEFTEAVNAPEEPQQEEPPEETPTQPSQASGRTEPDRSVTTAHADGSLCGNWPDSFELWPDRERGPVEDTVDEDGRSIRRRSAEGYTVEIHWPPHPQVEFDLDYEAPSDSTFWVVQGDPITRLGINPSARLEELPSSAPDTGLNPGIEFMRLSSEDPTMTSLDGVCTSVELRVFEGQQLIERIGIGVGSVGEELTVTDQSGNEFVVPVGIQWIELGPIVTEQRAVEAVPGSVTCDGVLVDVDTTTYRVDDSIPRSATLSEAIQSGHFTEIVDPLAESKTADPTEIWAVQLPGEPSDGTLVELNQLGMLSYIDADYYEEFIDPETGPTTGPGVTGNFERPIDALKAFFDNPAARTFIKSGLVELQVDDSTYAYGVPQGHGEDGWITVISVENDGDGWLVSGWTSAGC